MNISKKSIQPSSPGQFSGSFLEKSLFLIILISEIIIFFFLINEKWIPGGHDGFAYFSNQYYCLNQCVIYGENYQWSPFTTHGNGGTLLGYITLNGILLNILIYVGGLLHKVNFLPCFYAGMFVDELLLLIGVWLLSRRFLVSPFSIFFVAVSIMGSCIWATQPYYNFHFYYAIPLILHCIHECIDSGKWRYFFLAGSLLFLQCLGNLPYLLPVSSLVIFLYIFFYFILNYRNIQKKIKGFKFGWQFILIALLNVSLFVFYYIVLRFGIDHLVNYNYMRGLDWSNSLDDYLVYAGKFNWKIWLELILGVSPCIDYTLYFGVVGLPFAFLGLIFNAKRKNAHFYLVGLTLLLYSMGTIVSVFFYYFWPMMKYYRHLTFVSPIIKIFLCFMAGFGFDAVILNKLHHKKHLTLNIMIFALAICLFFVYWFLSDLQSHYYSFTELIHSMVSRTTPKFMALYNSNINSFMLDRTSLFVITTIILFFLFTFFNRHRYIVTLIAFILFLHFADVYTFKFCELRLKMTPLDKKLYNIVKFQPMPYPKRRDASFGVNNPRAELLKHLSIQEPGAFYWSTHAFLFKDELGNAFRTDFWQLPLDKYMRAYWGQPIHNMSIKPKGLFYQRRLEFPQEHPAALKISGVTEDKIQFFSEADIVASEDLIASLISAPGYHGNSLFLSPLNKKGANVSDELSSFSDEWISTDNRLYFSYKVLKFDSNIIEISINVKNSGPIWMLYSDVWHPCWKAIVNGKQTDVFRANLAYKAIKLEPGHNNVKFYFKNIWMNIFYFVFFIISFFWVMVILFFTIRIIINSTPQPQIYK